MCKVVDTGHSIKTCGLGFSAWTPKRRERAAGGVGGGASPASHELASIHPFPLNKPGCCNLVQCRALAIAREPYYFIGSSLFPSIRVCDIFLVCVCVCVYVCASLTAPTFVYPALPERASIFFFLLYSPLSLRAARARRISRY